MRQASLLSWGAKQFLAWPLAWIDTIILILYLGFASHLALYFSIPPVADPSMIMRVFFLFAGGLLVGMVSIHLLFRRSMTQKAQYNAQNLTYQILSVVTWVALVLLAVSWTYAFKKYGVLLNESPSFALRFITTSLHPLVPLESRLICTLLPLVLLYPVARTFKGRQRFFFSMLLLIIAITQLKFCLLFASAFGAFFLFGPQSFLRGSSIKSYAVWFVIIATLTIGGLEFVRFSVKDVMHLLSYPVMPPLASTSTYTHAPSDDGSVHRCEGYHTGKPSPEEDMEEEGGVPKKKKLIDAVDREFNRLRLIYLGLLSRTFHLPAELMRVFMCLRDQGWRPMYRGHQIFRVLGGYIPYYRLAYREFRPDQGSSVSSAVTNVATDSYFNAGLGGVLVSGIIVGVAFAFLGLLAQLGGMASLVWYFRFYFLMLLTEGSIITALLTLVPLVGVVAFDLLLKAWKKSSVSFGAAEHAAP